MKLYILIKKESSNSNGYAKREFFSKPSYNKSEIEKMCNVEKRWYDINYPDLEVEFEVGVFNLEEFYKPFERGDNNGRIQSGNIG